MRSVSFLACGFRAHHFNFEIIPFCLSDLRKKLKLVISLHVFTASKGSSNEIQRFHIDNLSSGFKFMMIPSARHWGWLLLLLYLRSKLSLYCGNLTHTGNLLVTKFCS